MANASNLFNRSYHKVPRKVDVFLKITGAADVNANGYTINYGSDLVSTVAKNGEGVIDITTKFGWSELVGCQVTCSDAAFVIEYTSDTASSSLVKLTSESLADGTTNADPDSAVIFVHLTFNTSSTVATK